MDGLRNTDQSTNVTKGLGNLNLQHRTSTTVGTGWRKDEAESVAELESAARPASGAKGAAGKVTEKASDVATTATEAVQRSQDDEGDLHDDAAEDTTATTKKSGRGAWEGISKRKKAKGPDTSKKSGPVGAPKPTGRTKAGSGAPPGAPSAAGAAGRKPVKAGLLAQNKRAGKLAAKGGDATLMATAKNLARGPKAVGSSVRGAQAITQLAAHAARAAHAVANTVRAVVAAVASAKVLLIAALVLVVILGLVIAVISIFPSIGDEAQKEEQAACTQGIPAGTANVTNLPPSVAGYGPEELTRAAIIMQVAQESGLDRRAQLVGLITAMQESDLGRDLTNRVPNTDGDAGIFQQRTYPGWYGSLEMINNPAYAARAFFNGVTATEAGGWGSVGGGGGFGHLPGLKDVKNWETLAPTIAASNVQKPREDLRGEYAKHEAKANEIINALAGTNVQLGEGGAVAGCAAASGVSGEATGTVKAVIENAMSYEGKGLTYNMGGGTLDGPTGNTLDCSSFVGSAWKAGAGITFGRSAQDQWNNLAAYRVDVADLQPGDLLFEAAGRRGTVGDPDAISHVMMYIGNGQMVEWGRSANGYHMGPISGRVEGKAYVGAARPPAPDTTAPEGGTA